MPAPSPDVPALAQRYQLVLPERLSRGTGGELLGRGTGASLEFQDRRAYVAGDDLRHLDWAAYARTDQLMVRLYREEIQPRLEVLIDASRSMGTDAPKAGLAVDLAALLVQLGRAAALPVRVLALADGPLELEPERLQSEGLELDGAVPLAESLRAAGPLLRPGALRYLVSDFLSPFDPSALVRNLAGRAGHLCLLQVLSGEDAEPQPGRALRLVDAETRESLDLVLDPHSVARYRARLRRLTDGLRQEARAAGGSFLGLVASEGKLEEACRKRLVPAGVLLPR